MYEFDPHNPETWRTYPEPDLHPRYQKELVKLAGLNPHGQPNLRIVWGATVKSDTAHDKSQLKYFCGYGLTEVQGFRYKGADGQWKFTETIEEIDPTIMLIPATERPQIGLPRWVIEEWQSPEQLAQAKRFQEKQLDDDGNPILRTEIPAEGVYVTYFIVQSLEGNYRGIGDDVLDFIRQKYYFEHNYSYEEQEKMREEYRAKEREHYAKIKAELNRAAAELDLRLPDEEKDRRAQLAEIQRKMSEKAEEESRRLTFYQRQ